MSIRPAGQVPETAWLGVHGTPGPPGEQLVGRLDELAAVQAFLGEAVQGGAALLVTGEAGLGKSEILDAAAGLAGLSGATVLRGTGTEFEAEVSYAGLQQILLPVLADLSSLEPVHQEALRVALGLGIGPPPGRTLVGEATVALLRRVAGQNPLVVLFDDVQWMDRAGAAVLAAVAQARPARLGLLLAARTAPGRPTEGALAPHLPLLPLHPLDRPASADLLRRRFPELVQPVADRLLHEAEGNPLALVELPAALSDRQRMARDDLPAVPTLGRRLQARFETVLNAVPAATVGALLLSSLEGSGDVGVLASAHGPGWAADLAPATDAGLVRLDQQARLRFRHPLIGAAVVAQASPQQRRVAHRALAGALPGPRNIERRAWHSAEAAVVPDEEVAGLLEEAARVVLGRGDYVAAVNILLKAADLSPGTSERTRRVSEAAHIGAWVAGDMDRAARLLDEVQRTDPDFGASLSSAVAAASLLVNGDGDVDTAYRLLVGALETYPNNRDAADTTLIEALHVLCTVCWYVDRPEAWLPLYEGVDRLVPGPPLTLVMNVRTYPDPVRTSDEVLDLVPRAIAGLREETDPMRINRIALGGYFLDRLGECRRPLERVREQGRRGAFAGQALVAMHLLSLDAYLTGRWDEVEQLATESIDLCHADDFWRLAWPNQHRLALLAAARGDDAGARGLNEAMTRWATPRGVRVVQRFVAQVDGLLALGRADFEAAYQAVVMISPAGELASHVPTALWVMLDVVEAAVRSGRAGPAAAHVAAMNAANVSRLSPRLALVHLCCQALVAGDDATARELFEAGLRLPGASNWAFDHARVQLLYGTHLRRHQSIAASREYLASAQATFEQLGAQPWVNRAVQELRATAAVRAGSAIEGALTPQEYEIARLAAAGLANKKIGEQLGISSRTVANHLYQVFPKLGISARAGLRDALAAREGHRPAG